MLFYKHPKVVPKLNILVNGNPTVQVEDFNYLGITLDQHNTWTPHIKKNLIKISSVICILCKLNVLFYNTYFVPFTTHLFIHIWFKSLGL